MLRRTLILFASVCALEPATTRPKTSRRHFVAGAAASLAFPCAASAALSDYKTELFVESGCGRRGPLGACLDARTAAPRDTTAADEAQAARVGAEKAAAQKARMEQELESPLVAELRRRTAANAEKNAREVELQMFQNSQSGEFGPFSRFVPVAKNDGKYVLVLAGEYEDLKKQKKVAKQKFLDDADARPYEARAAAVTESNARAKLATAAADGDD